MKAIACCADCANYSLKKHKCMIGCKDEGKATDHFYKDCILPDVPDTNAVVWANATDKMPEDAGWYLVYAPGYSGGSSSGLKCIDGIMFSKWNGKNWSIEVGYHQRPGCVKQWMKIPRPKEET